MYVARTLLGSRGEPDKARPTIGLLLLANRLRTRRTRNRVLAGRGRARANRRRRDRRRRIGRRRGAAAEADVAHRAAGVEEDHVRAERGARGGAARVEDATV